MNIFRVFRVMHTVFNDIKKFNWIIDYSNNEILFIILFINLPSGMGGTCTWYAQRTNEITIQCEEPNSSLIMIVRTFLQQRRESARMSVWNASNVTKDWTT